MSGGVQMPKIGVVIPAYNEEKNIGKTIEDILPYTGDIVVINDGSKDKTKQVIEKYPVKLIHRSKNLGLAKTVAEGFRYLLKNEYDYGIKMDADGQMDASKLKEFFETVYKKSVFDVICATFNKDTPWMIRKDMKIYSFIYKLATGINTTDLLSEYRAYSRKGMEYLVKNTSDEGYGSPLLLIDMHRNDLKSTEIMGGVSYSQKKFRPFPIDAQFALRKAFLTKTFRFKGLRPKMISILSIPFWVGLIIFNCTIQPKYHTFLPRKYVR